MQRWPYPRSRICPPGLADDILKWTVNNLEKVAERSWPVILRRFPSCPASRQLSLETKRRLWFDRQAKRAYSATDAGSSSSPSGRIQLSQRSRRWRLRNNDGRPNHGIEGYRNIILADMHGCTRCRLGHRGNARFPVRETCRSTRTPPANPNRFATERL